MFLGPGNPAGPFYADVGEIIEVDRPMSEVRAAFGQIDVLLNNAGGLVRHSPIVDASDDDIDSVFASTPAWLVQQRLMAVFALTNRYDFHGCFFPTSQAFV